MFFNRGSNHDERTMRLFSRLWPVRLDYSGTVLSLQKLLAEALGFVRVFQSGLHWTNNRAFYGAVLRSPIARPA